MNIVLTGGGTAGHVTPNIALADILAKDAQLHYLGTDGMERQLTKALTDKRILQYHTIKAYKLVRKLSVDTFALPFRLVSSVKQCKEILNKIQPDVIFGKGGYVSLPVAIAASKLSIPVIMHESDISMGLANKIALHYTDTMLSTFDTTPKCRHIGAIVRQDIYKGNKQCGLRFMGYNGAKPILLVMGGSLGAGQINNLICQCSSLTNQYDIFVITGKGKRVDCDFVRQTEFVTNISDIYSATTLAITRGGANSLIELASCGIPFVAIPLTVQSRGEQVSNCMYFDKHHCGIMLQSPATAARLILAVNHIDNNLQSYIECCKKMNLDATYKVVDLILDTARLHRLKHN